MLLVGSVVQGVSTDVLWQVHARVIQKGLSLRRDWVSMGSLQVKSLSNLAVTQLSIVAFMEKWGEAVQDW